MVLEKVIELFHHENVRSLLVVGACQRVWVQYYNS